MRHRSLALKLRLARSKVKALQKESSPKIHQHPLGFRITPEFPSLSALPWDFFQFTLSSLFKDEKLQSHIGDPPLWKWYLEFLFIGSHMRFIGRFHNAHNDKSKTCGRQCLKPKAQKFTLAHLPKMIFQS